MVLLLALSGCIWVDSEEYDHMRDQVLDADQDGFLTADEGGSDCDDSDPDVYPGAPETWYDGIDADCAEDDDFDQDQDSYTASIYEGDDCDDTDAEVHPGATEIWYDGLDQDCDGGNDYDADGDGYTSSDYEGDDCDDTVAAAHPGAEEVWYDGIDGDCLGGDDYDQDRDGFAKGEVAGTDCDDDDPLIHPLQVEVIGDKLDVDCDGGVDSFFLSHGPTVELTGLVGPEISWSDNEVSVGYGTEEFYDPSDGFEAFDALCVTAFDPLDLSSGAVFDYSYGFDSSSGNMGEVFDFHGTRSQYVWASALYVPGTNQRRLYLDSIEFQPPPPNETYGASVFDNKADHPYSAIDLHADPEGDLVAVACEATAGKLVVFDSPYDSFVPLAPDLVTVEEAEAYPLCEVVADGSDTVLVTVEGEEGVSHGTYDEEGEWNFEGELDLGTVPIDSWTVAQMEVEQHHGVSWTLVLDLAEGMFLWDETTWLRHQPAGSIVQADLTADAGGRAYLCGVTGLGTLRIWYGDLSSELTELTVGTGMTTVEQCAVAAAGTGAVMVAARGDDRLAMGLFEVRE